MRLELQTSPLKIVFGDKIALTGNKQDFVAFIKQKEIDMAYW